VVSSQRLMGFFTLVADGDLCRGMKVHFLLHQSPLVFLAKGRSILLPL